jgi:lipoyl(octanoyl) transferase
MTAPTIRKLGRVDYAPTLEAMRRFTAERDAATGDEIWLCEHPPLFTQGVAGRAEHVHDAGSIPVAQSNRGGQVTFHGPGQVVAYALIDLQRLRIYVKEYVFRIEQSVIKLLDGYGVTGHRVAGAPGIYVRIDRPFAHDVLAPPADPGQRFHGLGKIAALGIKVSRHCAYHGVAFNVAMDLRPFARIDPCGYAGLETIDLATLGVNSDWDTAAGRLGDKLASYLSP